MSASDTPSVPLSSFRVWLESEIAKWLEARPQGVGHDQYMPGDWINEGVLEGLRIARHGLLDELEKSDEGGGMAVETLRQIVEDTLLLAANIREGEHLGETGDTLEEREATRQWRIVELIVSIAERTAETAGLDEATIWIPDGVADVAFEGVRKPA